MTKRWEYCGGELGSTAVRIYSRGKIGRVVRTRMGMTHHSPGKRTVRYFVWSDPDTEFATEAEALAAARPHDSRTI